MPVSATAFENHILFSAWAGALILSALSVVVLLALVLRRRIMEREAKAATQRKEELSRYFYIALKSTVPLTSGTLPPLAATDYPILMRTAVDLLRSVRGDDVRRVIEVLNAWHMLPYLHNTAHHGRKGKRIQALTLLAHFSDEASFALLLTYITDPDIYVQIASLRGLALRGATGHIDQIVKSLTFSGQTNTLMLSDILQRFGTPAVFPLLTLARSDARTEIRLAAIMALGAISSLRSVTDLIKLASDPNADIRAQVISALGQIGDGRAAPVVAQHLEDPDANVRLQAVQTLGRLQNIATLPQLSGRLADEEWWVRFRAAEAVHRFGDKGIATLRAFSGHDNPAGVIARQVLAEHGVRP